MTDFDILRELKRNDERLRLTEVKEVPIVSADTFPVAPLLGGSTGDGTATFTTQFGRYKLMSGLCFFRLTIVGNTRTVAATGDARIGPLPFTSINIANSHTPVTLDTLNNINLLATTVQLTARIPPNTAYIEFVENPDNGAVSLLPASSWAATTAIRVAGWYEVA